MAINVYDHGCDGMYRASFYRKIINFYVIVMINFMNNHSFVCLCIFPDYNKNNVSNNIIFIVINVGH